MQRCDDDLTNFTGSADIAVLVQHFDEYGFRLNMQVFAFRILQSDIADFGAAIDIDHGNIQNFTADLAHLGSQQIGYGMDLL